MAVPVLWLLPAGSISGKCQGSPWHEQRLLENTEFRVLYAIASHHNHVTWHRVAPHHVTPHRTTATDESPLADAFDYILQSTYNNTSFVMQI